jgi:hypothetical protein
MQISLMDITGYHCKQSIVSSFVECLRHLSLLLLIAEEY